jgi:hypothetical protein
MMRDDDESENAAFDTLYRQLQSLASSLVFFHRPQQYTLPVSPIISFVLLYQSGHAQIYKHQSYRSKAITEPYMKCIVEVDLLSPAMTIVVRLAYDRLLQ